MSNDGWTDGSLTLTGKEIPLRTGYMAVGDLRFYPENPRLYSIVCSGDDEPSQAVIQKKLAGMELSLIHI